MHEPDTKQDLLAELGYETRDIRLKPMIAAFCMLGGLILVSTLACLVFYNATSPKYVEERALPAWVLERKLPPHPQVQPLPKEEMTLYYGAQDPKLAVIQKAKDDLVAQGIAGVSGGALKETFHSDYPGSGRYAGGAAHEGGEH